MSDKHQIEDGTSIFQLDQGPEIPSNMPLPSGMAAAALTLLTKDEIKQAVREGREDHERAMEKVRKRQQSF